MLCASHVHEIEVITWQYCVTEFCVLFFLLGDYLLLLSPPHLSVEPPLMDYSIVIYRKFLNIDAVII